MVNPAGMTLEDWAAQLLVDFPDDGIPQLIDPARWRDWGALVISCPSFAADAPNQYQYDDWRDWAQEMAAYF